MFTNLPVFPSPFLYFNYPVLPTHRDSFQTNVGESYFCIKKYKQLLKKTVLHQHGLHLKDFMDTVTLMIVVNVGVLTS